MKTNTLLLVIIGELALLLYGLYTAAQKAQAAASEVAAQGGVFGKILSTFESL